MRDLSAKQVRGLQKAILDDFRYFQGEGPPVTNLEVEGREEEWEYIKGSREAYERVMFQLKRMIDDPEYAPEGQDPKYQWMRRWNGDYFDPETKEPVKDWQHADQ